MTPDEVQRWLDAYLDAWKTYDRPAIEALFSEDVAYRYHPYDDPITGRDAVVASWLGDGQHAGASTRDEPGTYAGSYRPVAVDGDMAVAVGRSEEHTSEVQSHSDLVCRLLLEKKKQTTR